MSRFDYISDQHSQFYYMLKAPRRKLSLKLYISLFNSQVSNFSAIFWQEQVTFL
jgi:hypothetical protein